MTIGRNRTARPGGFARTTLAAGSVTVIASLPGFLTGALSVQLASDLRFSLSRLGLTIAIWRFSSAASANWLGKLADRIGGRWALRLSAMVTAISCVGIALSASSWSVLTGWLVVSGFAQALGSPAANRMLANQIPVERQGLAFGLKQAAPPLASMLAGLSVPLIATSMGWQGVFALAGAISAATLVIVGRRRSRAGVQEAEDAKQTDWKTLRALLLAIGLATAASSTVPVFFVPAGVEGGMSVSLAGAALAVASISAIVVRVILGLLADRRESAYLRICAGSLIIGAAGLAMLNAANPVLMTIGGILALGGAWGFPGVFWYAIVRAFPQAPGRTTGALTPGALIGATLGPLIGGALADHFGFGATWWVSVMFALLSAMAMLRASRELMARKSRGAND